MRSSLPPVEMNKFTVPLLLFLCGCASTKNYPPEIGIASPIPCGPDNCGKECWPVEHYKIDGATGNRTTETVLHCTLSLPAHTDSDYALLREFIEARYPEHSVVLVNEDETLLNENAEKMPVSTVARTFRVKGMRLWMVIDRNTRKSS